MTGIESDNRPCIENSEAIKQSPILVVKVGGAEDVDLEKVCDDVAEIVKQGQRIVLVHGASNETNTLSRQIGKPPIFVTSISGIESRYTDRETLEIFEMAAGKINKGIVEELQKKGVNAVGLSGLDGRLLEGQRKEAIKVIEGGRRKILRDDYTGRVERVNTDLIQLLFDNGYTLVVSPLAVSYQGEAMNVDGDRAAAIIASSLEADNLIILSNVPGLLEDVSNPASLITRIPKDKLDDYEHLAKGRMRKKIMGAREALESGKVKRVILGDSRIDHPIIEALSGRGTIIQ